MPAADTDLRDHSPPRRATNQLPFDPITPQHILNCSVHSWHPRYRSITPKTRLIPLPPAFLSYLRSDGIMLPPELNASESSDTEDEDEGQDPSAEWPETHAAIAATIQELGGKVYPKLNWSAPKDATWMTAMNTMECTTPNDIYLLLKSSDFVTHDLEQAFYGCTSSDSDIPYHLVLRKSIPSMILSMEFRCFVRQKQLVGICQRDLNYYEFLESLKSIIQELIEDFFEEKLQNSFPDNDFVFDVYVPQPKESGKVWLIDINPWAPRTDPLIFSWLELLNMEVPEPPSGEGNETLEDGVVRLSLGPKDEDDSDSGQSIDDGVQSIDEGAQDTDDTDQDIDDSGSDMDDVEELPRLPEFRTIKKDDPEAYRFNTPMYSAHKLPKDVVDAGMSGEGGMREFLEIWRQHEGGTADSASSDNDEVWR